MKLLKGIKSSIRWLLKAIFEPLGFECHIFPKKTPGGRYDFVLFDRNMLSSYYKLNANRELYDRAIRKAGVEWSDNFSKQCRYYSLAQLVKQALSAGKEADAAECGCWKGHSTYLISELLKTNGFKGLFHVFDSFEGGLSNLGAEDKNSRVQLTPDEVTFQKEIFASTEGEVSRVLADFNFVKLYPGWIPARFSEIADRRFSLVNIDVDLYQPTRDSLDFFYPKMIKGGIITFDDYGVTQFPGAQKAIDEYLKGKEYQLFYEIPTGGAFLIR